jgi:hypothetical protein
MFSFYSKIITLLRLGEDLIGLDIFVFMNTIHCGFNLAFAKLILQNDSCSALKFHKFLVPLLGS